MTQRCTPKKPKYLIELHGLPKRTNSNNGHWRTRQREALKWKRLVCELVTLSKMKPDKPIEKAKLTCIRFSSVEPDADGLVSSFKHVIDGLILAGVLENDRMSNIGMPEYRWEKVAPKMGKIQVIVEEVSV
jgi:hypothetical protein